jgi:hypothetical protein
MLKNLAFVVVLVAAALAGFIATRPSEFLIVRTRTLAAPPEVVHAYVNDFHRWVEWSPWEKIDPALRREYSGEPSGAGAVYEWSGNEQVGAGRMTIMESSPPNSVTIRLEFLKPFVATNTAQFDIVAGGLGTDVTWSMMGRNGFAAKAFSLVTDVDKAVGSEFEQGLADLDTVTAAATPPLPPAEPAPGEAPTADAAPGEGAPAAPAAAAPAAEAAPAAPAPEGASAAPAPEGASEASAPSAPAAPTPPAAQ